VLSSNARACAAPIPLHKHIHTNAATCTYIYIYKYTAAAPTQLFHCYIHICTLQNRYIYMYTHIYLHIAAAPAQHQHHYIYTIQTHHIYIYTYVHVSSSSGHAAPPPARSSDSPQCTTARTRNRYCGVKARRQWRKACKCKIFLHSQLAAHFATGWRRLIGSPKLQIIFHKRATKYRSLLQKIAYEDKGSYESLPPCVCNRCRAVL